MVIVAQAARRRLGLRRSALASAPLESPSPPPEAFINRPGLRVAGILDQFSHAALQWEFSFESLGFESWRQQIEEFSPHLLFVESAWRGDGDAWRYRVAGLDGPHPELVRLIDWCRSRGVPTVFWNKEDPPNYAWFIGAARLFDHVFTVDEGSLDRYRRDLGHLRVDVLPFAAQPRIHTPFMREADRRASREVVFAGTYFRAKYPERRHQMRVLLEPAREFGLDIYSRVPDAEEHRWPRELRSRVVGTLPYLELLDLLREYKLALNVSSVSDSPTMCPRRIFELLSAGVGVLSYPIPAIEQFLPSAGIRQASSANEAHEHLAEALSGGGERVRERWSGLRAIHRGHTYSHRIDQVLSAVGLPSAPPPGVAVVLTGEAVSDAQRARWRSVTGVREVHSLGAPAAGGDAVQGRVLDHLPADDHVLIVPGTRKMTDEGLEALQIGLAGAGTDVVAFGGQQAFDAAATDMPQALLATADRAHWLIERQLAGSDASIFESTGAWFVGPQADAERHIRTSTEVTS